MRMVVLAGLCLGLLSVPCHGDSPDATDDLKRLSATEIFNRRILPILQSENASSCTECHFGGVELKNYLHEDQATTFATLRGHNLIDIETPDKSKLLTFIARRPEKQNELLARVRKSEYQAFQAWIRAAVREPELLAAKEGGATLGTELPVEVIRHMRRDRVLQSFVENIWSEMGRCINCHSPERNQRQVREHGEQVSWIVPRDPAATLQKLVDGGNIDTDHPDESLVLLKPAGLEDHGGGPKFAVGSRTDKNFRRFLNDYASVVNGTYKRTSQLPKPSREIVTLTGQHLRIVDLPAEFDRKLLRADIFRWTDSGWAETPCGTAENPINGPKNNGLRRRAPRVEASPRIKAGQRAGFVAGPLPGQDLYRPGGKDGQEPRLRAGRLRLVRPGGIRRTLAARLSAPQDSSRTQAALVAGATLRPSQLG
jgi:hypothetical protein